MVQRRSQSSASRAAAPAWRSPLRLPVSRNAMLIRTPGPVNSHSLRHKKGGTRPPPEKGWSSSKWESSLPLPRHGHARAIAAAGSRRHLHRRCRAGSRCRRRRLAPRARGVPLLPAAASPPRALCAGGAACRHLAPRVLGAVVAVIASRLARTGRRRRRHLACAGRRRRRRLPPRALGAVTTAR
ncbi:hypothetical protein DAI22_01g314601 [Oryza sativa Japonica Group]|jgi:hypothetical protein|nr:hypothetical protein DAI22_01g314601 [Oryza sativa Japonica Group]